MVFLLNSFRGARDTKGCETFRFPLSHALLFCPIGCLLEWQSGWAHAGQEQQKRAAKKQPGSDLLAQPQGKAENRIAILRQVAQLQFSSNGTEAFLF